MTNILEGLVVVELASVLAGPLAGSFLAEHGAEVIKIENKKSGGDVTRQWRLASESADSEISAYYASANYGKRVMQLNLGDAKDYSALMDVIKKADVVISNFQQKTSIKLKVDYDTICAVNPSIIFAHLVAYSRDDARPGYDLVMQAEAGFISMNGSLKGEVAKMPVALIDVIAGHQIKEAILLGLIQRAKTGQGNYSEVSLFKSAISGLANQASNFLMESHVPKPLGTLHPNIAPYGDVVLTKDNYLAILAVGSDRQFEKLGKTLKLAPDLLHTFRFNKDRVLQREALMKEIQAKIESWMFNSLETSLLSANIPFCKVSRLDEVFENPLAKAMVIEEIMEGRQTKKVSNTAFTITMSDFRNNSNFQEN